MMNRQMDLKERRNDETSNIHNDHRTRFSNAGLQSSIQCGRDGDADRRAAAIRYTTSTHSVTNTNAPGHKYATSTAHLHTLCTDSIREGCRSQLPLWTGDCVGSCQLGGCGTEFSNCGQEFRWKLVVYC